MMKRILPAMALNLILSMSALAGTSVWKVQTDDSVLYIGGTCHVLRPSDYPLPDGFTRAYESSDAVVFETDLDAINSPAVRERLLREGTYGDGSNLQKALSPLTYGRLKRYCDASRIPLATLDKFKPPLLMATLLTLELQKLGVTQSGVDKHFYRLAARDRKKTEALESVDEQIDFLLSMGKGDENQFIDHSLEDLKKTAQTIGQLISAWRQGNQDELNDLIVAPLKTNHPGLYRTLLRDRNRKWLPKIARYLQSSRKEMVLVGVAHLVGEDGLLDQLRGRGYAVSRFDEGTAAEHPNGNYSAEGTLVQLSPPDRSRLPVR